MFFFTQLIFLPLKISYYPLFQMFLDNENVDRSLVE